MKNLLIVEDELTLLQVLAKKFKQEGFRVIQRLNGLSGYKSAIKYHPDLILLDIIMPIMDGMTMLEKLRRDKWGKDAKVIILTNLSDAGKINESTSKGVREYLIKSDWKLDDIVKKVSEELNISTNSR